MTIITKFVISPEGPKSSNSHNFLSARARGERARERERDGPVQSGAELAPAGHCRVKDRSQLVPHSGENQILVHFHQLSASDIYFCRAGQEIRPLSRSQGPRHFALLSYRCSIKVSHCAHLSLLPQPPARTPHHSPPLQV